MKTFTTIEEIMNELEKGDYCGYGIRNLSDEDLENLDRGYLDCSHYFIPCEGQYTDELLNGTCAIGVTEWESLESIAEKCNRSKEYCNTDVIALIADDHYEYGDDPDEIILGHYGCGAHVIGIINIK